MEGLVMIVSYQQNQSLKKNKIIDSPTTAYDIYLVPIYLTDETRGSL